MALRHHGAIQPLRPGALEAAAAKVKQREALKKPPRSLPRTEEELFDHILEMIHYDPAASVDFGDYARLGRFYAHWSKKEAEMKEARRVREAKERQSRLLRWLRWPVRGNGANESN